MGWKPFPLATYIVLTWCACRLGYLFFMANPYQVASLSNILYYDDCIYSFIVCVPAFLGWLCTLLNIVSQSTMGDFLATIIDSCFFGLKQYTRIRFSIVRLFLFSLIY